MFRGHSTAPTRVGLKYVLILAAWLHGDIIDLPNGCQKCSIPANGQCQEVDVAAAFGVFEGRLAPSGRE